MAGFWKATGRDKAVYEKFKLIGMRKTLVFYKGRAPNGQKSDWIMHEYRLESDLNAPPQVIQLLYIIPFLDSSFVQVQIMIYTCATSSEATLSYVITRAHTINELLYMKQPIVNLDSEQMNRLFLMYS